MRGLPFGNIAPDRRFAVAFDARLIGERRPRRFGVRFRARGGKRPGSDQVRFNPGFRMIDRALFAFESIRARGLGEIDPGAEFSVTSDRRAVTKIRPGVRLEKHRLSLKKHFSRAFLTPLRSSKPRSRRRSRLNRAILGRLAFESPVKSTGRVGERISPPVDTGRTRAGSVAHVFTYRKPARFAAHAPAPVSQLLWDD